MSIQERAKISSTNPDGSKNVVKVTSNLPVRVFEALEELSKKRGVSMTEILRQAISTEHFVQEKLERGEALAVFNRDRTAVREVTFRNGVIPKPRRKLFGLSLPHR